MFYHFSQNNSGGSFIVDHRRGISVNVVVEGATVEEITERAKDIGLYFDGVDDGSDCECCGDRWYEPWGEGDAAPSIYGQDVSEGTYTSEYTGWVKDGPEGYVHYRDGRVVPIILQKKVKTKKSK